jgi:hypothetical protein
MIGGGGGEVKGREEWLIYFFSGAPKKTVEQGVHKGQKGAGAAPAQEEAAAPSERIHSILVVVGIYGTN